jgi:tetratricopeptide (TPR) repeat protein
MLRVLKTKMQRDNQVSIRKQGSIDLAMRKYRDILTGILIGLAAPIVLQAQSKPQSALNAANSAIQLEQQGRNAEAETAWRAVAKLHPASAEPYAHLGLLEARQEHYKEAIPLYKKALTLNPAMPGLRLNLGLALFKAGDLKQAIVVFQPLLKSLPKASPDAQRLKILLGMAHYGLGNYAQATPYLKEAASSDPQNLALRLSLAHSCLWSKQYQCVLDTYHEILALNAESAEADMLAGEAQDELKNHVGAIEQFQAAVRANPKEPNVHFGLGYLLWTQRRYPEAVDAFQAELANDPSHAQSMLYEADADMQLNHPELALPLLEKVKQLAPQLSLARLDLGLLYADAGRKDEALAEMQEAARLAPDEASTHWHLARLYRTMGKSVEAKTEFAKAGNIHKASDDALKDKMSGAGTQPKPAGTTDKP